MTRGTRCLWLLVLFWVLWGSYACQVGEQCMSTSPQNTDRVCQDTNGCAVANDNCTCQRINNTATNNSTPKPTPSSNIKPTPAPTPTPYPKLNETAACKLLTNYYDDCNDPTLFFSKLGLAILDACCEQPGGQLRTCYSSTGSVTPPSLSSSTSGSTTAFSATTSSATDSTTKHAKVTTTTSIPTGTSTTGVNRGDKFHFQSKYRLLTPRDTMLLVVCGMCGVAIIAFFLYVINPSINGCHTIPYDALNHNNRQREEERRYHRNVEEEEEEEGDEEEEGEGNV